MGDYGAIKQFGKKVMERYGWEKLVDFNANRRVPSTFVDQLWLHKGKQLWAFIEEKYGEDTMSDDQYELMIKFICYGRPGVFYTIVSSEEDWERVASLARKDW